jgi:hypothetical protein
MKDAMYEFSVPVLLRCLGSLDAVLDKAVSFAEAKKIDTTVLLGMRLAPDMFPLSRQIQLVSDFAKSTCARLAGQEVPKWDDKETTLAELRERIARTRALVESFAPAQFEGAATRTVAFKAGTRDMSFVGSNYLAHYAMPNFYFHLTTAYAILRHAGVELGKRDFIGVIPSA